MDARTKGQMMVETVRAGKGMFRQHGGRWVVVGPIDWESKSGQVVTITKASGETSDVRLYNIAAFRDQKTPDGGVWDYVIADFDNNTRTIQTPTAAPRRSDCPHGDTDNNGICYACGTHVRSADIGDYFTDDRTIPAMSRAEYVAQARRRLGL